MKKTESIRYLRYPAAAGKGDETTMMNFRDKKTQRIISIIIIAFLVICMVGGLMTGLLGYL
ncbi:MAG: hypothetical protein LUE63_09760 [Lachnospiraceae bacterium]|nr:hypothetical protein [Lachnospiraceae bacterium]